MLRSLQLLLPALIPSWRFFDYIAPSPRIQYALLNAEQRMLCDWQEFRPRPARLSITQMLQRMLWNPQWNESLFMTSCAERIMENHTAHSENQILARMGKAWNAKQLPALAGARQIQFRLVFLEREGRQLLQQVCFVSRLAALPERTAP
jgi:hypothetical protein